MQTRPEILNLADAVLSGLEHVTLLWQLAVLGVSLILAWGLNQLIRKRIPAVASGSWRLGVGGIHRVLFPLSALLLVLVGRAVLARWQHVDLLSVAVPLLLSLALVRLAVYLLRHVFPPSDWLRASERFIAGVIWVCLALHITGFLPEILRALDEIGFTAGRHKVSLLLILQGVFSVAVTLLLALWLGRLGENRIMRAEQLEMNLRVVLTKVVRAVLLVLAVLIALPAAGIDITVLSVFGGALGVGLGFGLQKIASNYVSGFIILLDHSIRIGDMITVENRYGAVTQLTTRYLVLKGLDGTEAIIPNETLITSTVVNHSYSNRQMRISIPVQISYDSPLDEAMRIMLEAGRRHPRVLQDPEPGVSLNQFAENGIALELAVWICDPEEGQGSLRSDLNLAIWQEFRKAGIEIPYPHRDVRILDRRGGATSPGS